MFYNLYKCSLSLIWPFSNFDIIFSNHSPTPHPRLKQFSQFSTAKRGVKTSPATTDHDHYPGHVFSYIVTNITQPSVTGCRQRSACYLMKHIIRHVQSATQNGQLVTIFISTHLPHMCLCVYAGAI